MIENLKLQMEINSEDSVSIPEGARLQFVRIIDHEIITDEENRKFCVFILEIRSNVASPSIWHVYRRYTEFRTLSHNLRIEGYFVPGMPPKHVVGLLVAEFIEKRKVDCCELHAFVDVIVIYIGRFRGVAPSCGDAGLSCRVKIHSFHLFLIKSIALN